MSVQAMLLVLAAALLHASWNFVVKSSDDRLGATWAVAAGGALINIPVLVVLGLPDRSVFGWLALSALLHVGYGYALAAAYNRVDLASAYPIARGTAPLIVTIVGILLLGDTINPLGIVGIVAVTASLALVGVRHVPSGVWWAVLTGLMIASYTLVDGAGVRADDESIRYIGMLFVLHAALFTVVLGLSRRSPRTMVATVVRDPGRLLIGGGASAGAYLLVMIAARTTPLGLVAGLREISAIFGVLAGRYLLAEHVSRQHALAVAVAVAGSILIVVN